MEKEAIPPNRPLDEGEYHLTPNHRIRYNHPLKKILGDIDLKIDYTINPGKSAVFLTISTQNEGGGNYIVIDTDDNAPLAFNSFEEIERCILDFKTKYKLLIPNSTLI